MNRNCWEVKKCGREPEGSKVEETAVCPAASDENLNGVNGGKNAGRICWAVAGTFCDGKVQCEFADKEMSCMSCEFFKMVKEEEGTSHFLLLKPVQTYKK
jgi:hypothetical protein